MLQEWANMVRLRGSGDGKNEEHEFAVMQAARTVTHS